MPMHVFRPNCTLSAAPKNKDANEWTEIWQEIISQRETNTLRLALWETGADYAPAVLPHSNLTYAALCTIIGFEALIKGMSSNKARKQKQKQRNKWFSSNPSLMFTSCLSQPDCRPTLHDLISPYPFTQHPTTNTFSLAVSEQQIFFLFFWRCSKFRSLLVYKLTNTTADIISCFVSPPLCIDVEKVQEALTV